MADVFLSYSRADEDAALLLAAALEAAGLDVARSAVNSLDANHPVAQTPCVIVLWSAKAASAPDRAQEVKLALAAWSTDRLVLAVLDDSELQAGLRDLKTYDLSADRKRTTKEIIERAGHLKTTRPRAAPPVEGKTKSAAKMALPVGKNAAFGHGDDRHRGDAGRLPSSGSETSTGKWRTGQPDHFLLLRPLVVPRLLPAPSSPPSPRRPGTPGCGHGGSSAAVPVVVDRPRRRGPLPSCAKTNPRAQGPRCGGR